MHKTFKKESAFTLSEVILVFFIIGIIVTITLKVIQDTTTAKLNKYMYYSAFTNLTAAVSKLIDQGCNDYDTSAVSGCVAGKLPTQGHTTSDSRGLCDRLAETFNTVDTVNCTYGSSGTNTTNPNFTVTNGMKFYNFGVNVNASNLFTPVYIDIDGPKRKKEVDKDLMQFNINTDGTVRPIYNTAGANNTKYLSASVKYINSSGVVVWVVTNVNYQTAVCSATGKYDSTTNCTQATDCVSNDCKIIVNKPGFMFFTK